jgi:hypothetical protein
MANKYTDAEFIEELESFLDVGNDSGIKPSPPVFYTASGAVNRSKTLELDCFDGMTEQKKAELQA